MNDFSVIKTLRRKRGLSSEELASKANLTRATVAKIEAGEGNPTVATLDALAQALGLSGSELLRLAEKGSLRRPEVSRVRRSQYQGRQYRLGDLELFHLQLKAGKPIKFDPGWHADTGELILVLAGRLRLVVGGEEHELKSGEALGFKALREHVLKAMQDTEIMIIHHSLF